MRIFGTVLSLLLNFIIITYASTPLCLLCPCNSEPNNPPNINCYNSNVSNIFDNKFWIDDFNNSYPIQSLIYKYNNLENLTTQFPASNLTKLDLSNNVIKKIGDGVFSGLQELEELILANNDIHHIKPNAFLGVYDKNDYFPLKSLRTLDLGNNKIHTLHADTFEHIDELHTLILRNNPFKFIDSQTLSAIASLVYLKELDISYTQLKNLPKYFMHTPKYLKVLDLSGNNFTEIPKTLGESHALEVLYLNNNPLRYLAKSNGFPKIRTLKILHLSHMALLERLCEYSFNQLQNLEELHMSCNPKLISINSKAFIIDAQDVEQHISLKKIFINNNNLSYLERNTVDIKKMENINISKNPWSCDCLNQWLIDDVIPLYLKTDEDAAKQLRCAKPTEMENVTLYELHVQNKTMRCLRFYETPMQNPWMLIGVVSGVLIGVVLSTLVVHVYRIKILNIGNFNYPAYSRV